MSKNSAICKIAELVSSASFSAKLGRCGRLSRVWKAPAVLGRGGLRPAPVLGVLACGPALLLLRPAAGAALLPSLPTQSCGFRRRTWSAILFLPNRAAAIPGFLRLRKKLPFFFIFLFTDASLRGHRIWVILGDGHSVSSTLSPSYSHCVDSLGIKFDGIMLFWIVHCVFEMIYYFFGIL